MSNQPAPVTDHVEDIDDGCGCAEVWAALSEQRAATDGGIEDLDEKSE